MILILAEKPSLARDIEKALKEGGASGYKVLALRGHLVKRDSENSKWDLNELPLNDAGIGKGTKLVPISTKAEDADLSSRIGKIKKALEMNDLDMVYSAGDHDPEGSNLIMQILEYFDFAKFDDKGVLTSKKPIKRMIFKDLTLTTIFGEFTNPKEIETDIPFIYASKNRDLADSLVGFNLTRLFALLYGSYGEKITVGRVQTPAVGMIRNRELEIENFVPKDVFKIKAFVEGQKLPFLYSGELDEKTYKTKAAKKGDKLVIYEIKGKNKSTKPPPPPEHSDVLLFCGAKFGMDPSVTNKILQTLYEKKLTSYPRTDSKYLTVDMFDEVREILDTLTGVPDGLLLDPKNKNCFDDSKVRAHYGIIPLREPNKGEISEAEQKVFSFVKARLIMSLMGNLKQKIVIYVAKVEGSSDDGNWQLKGSTVESKGFTDYEGGQFCATPKALDVTPMSKNQSAVITEVLSEATKTKPPGLIKKHELQEKMKNVKIKGLDGNVDVSEIGTSSTRSGIVDQLVSTGKLKDTKKGLITTDIGKKIHTIAAGTLTLQTTAYFETATQKIKYMTDGSPKIAMDDFIAELQKWVNEVIKHHKANPIMPKPKSTGDGKFKGKGKTFKSTMKEGDFEAFEKGFKMKKDGNEHVIWKATLGREFTEEEAKKLFGGAKIKMTDLKSKANKVFKATVSYNMKAKKLDLSFD